MKIEPRVKRIAVLYSELSGYMAACLKSLKMCYEVELLVFKWPVVSNAPFDEQEIFGWIDRLYEKNDFSADKILEIVEAFDPHGIFIPGWMDPDYLKVARVMKRRQIPVVAGLDTPWSGALRQRMSKYLASWYLQPAIDVLWAAGERQRVFARHLGYTGESCWSGLYACDWSKFAVCDTSRKSSTPYFLFAGRYSEEKGLNELVDAYQLYRQNVNNPWPLVCAGTGELVHLLDRVEGIENRGFVQPDELPVLMGQAGAFILPSRREPWGVVIHEAAASGLPLLCSSACGAALHLLQDRYNGFLFEAGDANYLASCMIKLDKMAGSEREKMGRRSHELSKQFTPERWAETLMAGLASLAEAKQDLVPA